MSAGFENWWRRMVERNPKLGGTEPVRMRPESVRDVARQAWELGEKDGGGEGKGGNVFEQMFGGRR